jgi:glutaredoxin
MNIIVYTKTGCPWCAGVIKMLRESKLSFEKRDVLRNKIYLDELLDKSGQSRTPTLDIDGFILADSDKDQVYEYLNKKGIIDDKVSES